MEIKDHAIRDGLEIIRQIYLDGNKFSLVEGIMYLKGQGFSQKEAGDYILLLCREE